MSEKTEEITEVSAISITLVDEEIKIIEGLIGDTKYPHDFIEKLDAMSIPTDRKLVIMYHFAQGHMYSAISQFLGDALPRMMGMGAAEEGLKG